MKQALAVARESQCTSTKCSPIQRVQLFAYIAAVLLLGATAFAQTPSPAQFRTATLFDTGYAGLGHGGTPESIAVGDFNGDGKKDIVAVGANCTCPAVVTTFLGNGTGGFTLQQQQGLVLRAGNDGPGQHNPQLLAVGDFNRDGHQDVAVYVPGNGTLSYIDIYLGDGKGNLTFSNNYSIGSTVSGTPYEAVVAAADVNGDHKLDLVAITSTDNMVTVLLGNGDGTFQNGALYPCCTPGGEPLTVSAADLNNDGHLDIEIEDAAGGVDVLLNSGSGTFEAPVFYQAPSCDFHNPCFGGVPAGEGGIAAGDLNGDGNSDIVISSQTGAWVYLGNGDGTLQQPTNFAYSWADGLVLADINGDKKLDIISPNYYDNNVWVLLGNGNGTFQPPVAYATDGFPQSIAVSDFNSDGKLDFAVGSDTGPFVSLVVGNGDGTFRDSENYGVGGNWFGQATADFNKDGNMDVVQFSSNLIAVMLGNTHGVLGAPVLTTPNGYNTIEWVAAGDVNGDGKPDLAISYVTTTTVFGIAVLLGNGNGTFQSPAFYSSGDSNAYPGIITLADVNKDGRLDIIETNGDNTVSVLLNTGGGSFGAPTVLTGGNGGFIATGDFNKDGKIDLAINDWTNNSIDIFLGEGNGNFHPMVAYSVIDHPEWVAVGDFNKDGKLDLATGGYSVTGGDFNSSGIAILLGNGNGTFGNAAYYSTYPNAFPNDDVDTGTVADVNLDGIADLVVTFKTTHLGFGACCNTPENIGLGIFLGNGDGTFTFENPEGEPGIAGGPFLVGTGSLGGGLSIADFNEDGALDAAVLNEYNFGGGSGYAYTTILFNSTLPVSLSPKTLRFPAQKVGTSSKAQTVILTNDESTTLSISSTTLTGADPGDFSFTSSCKATVLTGADCTIGVTFKPTQTGTRTATLQVVDSAGTQTVSLTGTGE